MNSTRQRVIGVSLVLGLLGTFITFAVLELRNAQRGADASKEWSKMLELRNALAVELENYYKQHGQYPMALEALPLTNFDWGSEGTTPLDLDAFSYESTGRTFEMRWSGKRGYEVHLSGAGGNLKFQPLGLTAQPTNAVIERRSP